MVLHGEVSFSSIFFGNRANDPNRLISLYLLLHPPSGLRPLSCSRSASLSSFPPSSLALQTGGSPTFTRSREVGSESSGFGTSSGFVASFSFSLFAFLRSVSYFLPLVPELYSLPCLISLLGKRLPSMGPTFGRASALRHHLTRNSVWLIGFNIRLWSATM